jgi:hypothetical protein
MSVMSMSAASFVDGKREQLPFDDALTLGRLPGSVATPSVLAIDARTSDTLPVGMTSVLAGLAVVSVLFASVLTGVCIALYTRSHWSGMTERARRFVPSKQRPSDDG